MKRMLSGLVAALALVVVPLGGAETSYSDPVGDSGTAPDIGAVTVSDLAGVITFDAAIRLVPNSWLFVALDTSGPTFDIDGVNWAVGVTVRPDGSKETLAASFPLGVEVPLPVLASVIGDRVEISISTSDYGIDDAFGFAVLSEGSSSETEGPDDIAPDPGLWTYTLAQPAPPAVVKPVIGKPAAQPVRPTAGKRFTVTFAVTRSDDGRPLTLGTASCATKIAGRLVPHRHTFRAGTLRATLVVPKSARGKRLQVAVKIRAGAQTATKVVTFKVR